MLLAIDVGNTTVHFGLFDGKKLVGEWRVETRKSKIKNRNKLEIPKSKFEIEKISRVIVSSVVPRVSKLLKKKFPHAIFVNHKNIGIKIRVAKPAQVGADRLVNALAAHKLYGGPAVIVDFGTATTFDVINAKGEYLGGAIAPGLELSRQILHERTAKLPLIPLKTPRNVIGKSTVEAMRSGLVFGYAAMVEGMIGKIKIQVTKSKENPKVKIQKFKIIATGGLAQLIYKFTDVIDIIDDKLTLKGLRLIRWIDS